MLSIQYIHAIVLSPHKHHCIGVITVEFCYLIMIALVLQTYFIQPKMCNYLKLLFDVNLPFLQIMGLHCLTTAHFFSLLRLLSIIYYMHLMTPCHCACPYMCHCVCHCAWCVNVSVTVSQCGCATVCVIVCVTMCVTTCVSQCAVCVSRLNVCHCMHHCVCHCEGHNQILVYTSSKKLKKSFVTAHMQ